MSASRLWADIDLAAVHANVRRARELMGDAAVMAVVKADGHGVHEIARTALDAGAACLGVAHVEEGLCLRETIRDTPVIVFTDPLPGEEHTAVAHGLTLTISGEDTARRVPRPPPVRSAPPLSR